MPHEHGPPPPPPPGGGGKVAQDGLMEWVKDVVCGPYENNEKLKALKDYWK